MFRTKCWFLLSSIDNVDDLGKEELLSIFTQWLCDDIDESELQSIVKQTLYHFHHTLKCSQMSKFHDLLLSKRRANAMNHNVQSTQQSSTSSLPTILSVEGVLGCTAQFLTEDEFIELKYVCKQIFLAGYTRDVIFNKNKNKTKVISYEQLIKMNLPITDSRAFNNGIIFSNAIIFDANIAQEMHEFNKLQSLCPDPLPKPNIELKPISLLPSTVKAISTTTVVGFNNDSISVLNTRDIQNAFYNTGKDDKSCINIIKQVVIDQRHQDFSINHIKNTLIKFFNFNNNSDNNSISTNENRAPVSLKEYQIRLSSIDNDVSRNELLSIVASILRSNFPQMVEKFDIASMETYNTMANHNYSAVNYQNISHFLRSKMVYEVILPRTAAWQFNDLINNDLINDNLKNQELKGENFPSIKTFSFFVPAWDGQGLQIQMPNMSQNDDNNEISICYGETNQTINLAYIHEFQRCMGFHGSVELINIHVPRCRKKTDLIEMIRDYFWQHLKLDFINLFIRLRELAVISSPFMHHKGDSVSNTLPLISNAYNRLINYADLLIKTIRNQSSKKHAAPPRLKTIYFIEELNVLIGKKTFSDENNTMVDNIDVHTKIFVKDHTDDWSKDVKQSFKKMLDEQTNDYLTKINISINVKFKVSVDFA